MAITREDFLLNDDGDFPLQDTIINGVYLDTPYGNSEEQHKKDILVYKFGDLKQFPSFGFGVNSYLNSEFNGQSVERNLKIQFDLDGYTVKNGAVIPAQGGGFIISTKYIDRK